MPTSVFSSGNLPLDAIYGGTGLSNFTTGDLIYANSSSTLTPLNDIATGNALISGGTSTAPSWGKIGLTTHVTGTLPAGNGGTGIASYTVGDIIYASGSTAFSALSDVATGNALISGGTTTAPSWGKIGLTTHISGTLAVGNGGTNITSYAVGDIIYASGSTTLSKLADVATGNVLISGGVTTAPSWGKIGLTTHVTGVLPVANGGTNATAFSPGSVVFADTGGTYTENNNKFYWDNGNFILKINQQTIIGADTSTSKASIGLTLATNQNNTFSTNNDMTDSLRQSTLYNVSSNTNNYCAYTWRVGSLTLDSKFVKTGSSTSSVYWTFFNGSAADQYVWDSAGNGFIGTSLRIGTLSGSASSPLDVTTSSAKTVSTYGFLNSGGTTGTNASSGSQQFSATFSARITCASEIDITSDIREKEIIDYPDSEILFNAVNNIIPIHFLWKYKDDNQVKLGISAQQLIECVPEAVTGEEGEINGEHVDDKLTVNYNQIVVACIGAIKHLSKKVEFLETQLKGT